VQLLGNVTQKMEELLHHTLRQEPQEEEGPDLQIDVGFVFKVEWLRCERHLPDRRIQHLTTALECLTL
jgi:hypothetical protein